MKNLITILAIFLALNLNAKVWRLNNLPGTDADFTTLQDANNASYVNAGDTLHLEASSGSYGDLTATKSLVILGAGYFLNENLNLQANFNTSQVGKIYYNDGSQGSSIAGCTIYLIRVSTSNLLIERNYIIFNENYYNRANSSGGICFYTNNVNNIFIRNNYILNTYSSSDYCPSIFIYSLDRTGINNVLITNNFIATNGTSTSKGYVIDFSSGFSGIIENNVIYGMVYINNAKFNNNILRYGTFTYANCEYNNNIGNSTQFGISNGNQQNVTMNNVFLGATGNSTDSQWQLKVGSPAIGAGVGGVDCGMFGGTFPYKLSGIPPIPSIYFHSQTIDNVNQKLNVEIKAKSNN